MLPPPVLFLLHPLLTQTTFGMPQLLVLLHCCSLFCFHFKSLLLFQGHVSFSARIISGFQIVWISNFPASVVSSHTFKSLTSVISDGRLSSRLDHFRITPPSFSV